MPELLLNLHMHTTYSDGTGSHRDIAEAALKAGIDVVIVTDHNVLVQDVERYVRGGADGQRRVLLLVGEEIHDVTRKPQKNHTLVFGAGRELSTFASKPQRLIDQADKLGALTFLAHPHDPELPMFNEPDISWVDWEVRGFTGIELWNGLSEMKTDVHSYPQAIFYVFFPQYVAHGPLPQTLKKWDELTSHGSRVVAVGGSDAHALKLRLGPLRRTVFPYVFHFRSINTHLLTERGLGEDLALDRQMVYDALRKGHAFIGYDLPHPTRGFRFTAQGEEGAAQMGDEIRLKNGLTLQVRLPIKTECRLLRDGNVIKTWLDREICAQIINKPGVYRVECYLDYLGRKRGWIFSNPIYVR